MGTESNGKHERRRPNTTCTANPTYDPSSARQQPSTCETAEGGIAIERCRNVVRIFSELLLGRLAY